MIRIHKIQAMLYHDMLTFTHTKERMIEFLFFPITSTIIWGLFANSFRALSPQTAVTLLIINIFWAFSFHAQSSANLQINMDVWSRSLNQLLVSGINEFEYLFSRLLFSVMTSLIIGSIMLWIASYYGFVVPSLIPFLSLVSVTILASVAWGILVVSLYILLGKEYAFLSWSFLQLIILLSAPFFPISTYPRIVQYITVALPHTWIFECLKSLAATGSMDPMILLRAFVLATFYFAASLIFYRYVFNKARKTGGLVRLGF